MSFPCGLLLAAVAAPSSFFAGPAKVGDSVTYRVTTTIGAQTAPNVATIALTWSAPAKLYARVAGSTSQAALAVTRAPDGQLSVASPSATAPAAALIATLLGQLNFPGHLAASLDGSDHAQTSLDVTPPAPQSTASPAPKPPATVNVPLDVNLLSATSALTLLAEGTSSHQASGGGRGGRGGGMGSEWRGRSNRSEDRSNGNAPLVDIALQATFDLSGMLQQATYRETFTSRSSSGSQTVEHSITIERVK